MVRAMAANDQVRIYAASTKELVEYARKAHQTSDVVTAALGRLLTAGAMMGGMMKGKGDVLTLQIGCAGPIKGLTVTVIQSQDGERVQVKGYANQPMVDLPLNEKGKLDVSGALGAGILTVIKDMGLKEPFSGQTELISGEIAEDLTYYFANSEQIPSSVALGVLLDGSGAVKQAGGFLVQLLPFAGEEAIAKLEKTLAAVQPVTTMLNQGMTPEQMLEDLFGDLGLNIIDTVPTEFHCNCSKDRVQRAIVSIGKKELNEMIAENHSAEVKCHFCNTSYTFTVEEMKLINQQRGKNK